jgi:hypothetical protein
MSIPGVTASSVDGELLWGFWYPALRSDDLRGRALVTSTRMDVPLVLGRDAAGRAAGASAGWAGDAEVAELGRRDSLAQSESEG